MKVRKRCGPPELILEQSNEDSVDNINIFSLRSPLREEETGNDFFPNPSEPFERNALRSLAPSDLGYHKPDENELSPSRKRILSLDVGRGSKLDKPESEMRIFNQNLSPELELSLLGKVVLEVTEASFQNGLLPLQNQAELALRICDYKGNSKALPNRPLSDLLKAEWIGSKVQALVAVGHRLEFVVETSKGIPVGSAQVSSRELSTNVLHTLDLMQDSVEVGLISIKIHSFSPVCPLGVQVLTSQDSSETPALPDETVGELRIQLREVSLSDADPHSQYLIKVKYKGKQVCTQASWPVKDRVNTKKCFCLAVGRRQEAIQFEVFRQLQGSCLQVRAGYYAAGIEELLSVKQESKTLVLSGRIKLKMSSLFVPNFQAIQQQAEIRTVQDEGEKCLVFSARIVQHSAADPLSARPRILSPSSLTFQMPGDTFSSENEMDHPVQDLMEHPDPSKFRITLGRLKSEVDGIMADSNSAGICFLQERFPPQIEALFTESRVIDLLHARLKTPQLSELKPVFDSEVQPAPSEQIKKSKKKKNKEEAPAPASTAPNADRQIFNFSIPPFSKSKIIKGSWKGGSLGGKLDAAADDGPELNDDEMETSLSWKKLEAHIACTHPRDPETKLELSFFSRIVVDDFYGKFWDFLSLQTFCKAISKVCKRWPCSRKTKKKLKRPESLADLPESNSSSDSDPNKGLSEAALALDEGTVLYLQTAKTLLVMMIVLGVLNLPLYTLYYNMHPLQFDKHFGSLFAVASLGSMGSTVSSCDWFDAAEGSTKTEVTLACPPGYIHHRLDNFGFVQLKDLASHRVGRGAASCFAAVNPLLSAINYYLQEEKDPEIREANLEAFHNLQHLKVSPTTLNLDPFCNREGMWADESPLDDWFKPCLFRESCTLQVSTLDLNATLKPSCNDRSEETHSEAIVSTACFSDSFELPVVKKVLSKESIGLLIALFNILVGLFVMHAFSRLKAFNEEYMTIIDNKQVEMDDFSVQIQQLQLSKAVQDPRMIKMKVWLHFRAMLLPFVSPLNQMEIADVALASSPDPIRKELLRMQELSQKINNIKVEVCSKALSEDAINSRREQMDKLMIRLVKLKQKYLAMSSIVLWDSQVEDMKLPTPALMHKKMKRKADIPYAFITFKHCETKEEILKYFSSSSSWLSKLSCCRGRAASQYTSLFGESLDIGPALSPDQLLWENLDSTSFQQTWTKLVTLVLWAGLALFTLLISIVLAYLHKVFENKLPHFDCTSVEISKKIAFQDETSEAPSGIMACFCRSHESSWQTDFSEFGNDSNFCLKYTILDISLGIVEVINILSPVLMIEAARFLLSKTSQQQKCHFKFEEQSSSFTAMFSLEFAILGLILLYRSFDPLKISDAFLGIDSSYRTSAQPIYDGFSQHWFEVEGVKLVLYIVASSVVSNCIAISQMALTFFQRWRDRSYSSSIKKNPGDQKCDKPKTALSNQQELHNLNTGPPFQVEKEFARLMSVLLVTLFFAPGLPCLFLVGVFFFGVTLVVKKWMILKYYRKSPESTRIILQHSLSLLNVFFIIHFIAGGMFLINPNVVLVNELIEEEEGGSFIEEQARSIGLSHFLTSRFEHTFQIVYLLAVIIILVVYFLGTQIVSLLGLLGSWIGGCLSSLCSSKGNITQIQNDDPPTPERSGRKLHRQQASVFREDFSDNFYFELNPTALAQLYEGAQADLQDLWSYFHSHQALREQLETEAKTEWEVTFHELCYLNKATAEQVLEYEQELMKRCIQIEEVVDCHFDLLIPTMEKALEAKIKSKAEMRAQNRGYESLSFAQQVQIEMQDLETFQNHPDLRFDDPEVYPYSRKVAKIKELASELIQADKDRPENRTSQQTICRIGSTIQSYQHLDHPDNALARQLYFQFREEEAAVRELKKRARRLKLG